jgi:hypothetical protein
MHNDERRAGGQVGGVKNEGDLSHDDVRRNNVR